MKYGRLRHEGIVLPELLPHLNTGYRWLLKLWDLLHVDPQLDFELREIARQVVASRYEVLLHNLHYEIGGGGCISAALPADGGYAFLRVLEWPLPELQGKSVWADLGCRARVRQIPGYVGALSGDSANGWSIAMNMSPNALTGINPLGHPVSWVIRAALCDDSLKTPLDVARFIGKHPVVRGAFITVVSRSEALMLNVGGFGMRCLAHVRYPAPIVVGNDWATLEPSKWVQWLKQQNSTEQELEDWPVAEGHSMPPLDAYLTTPGI